MKTYYVKAWDKGPFYLELDCDLFHWGLGLNVTAGYNRPWPSTGEPRQVYCCLVVRLLCLQLDLTAAQRI
jgi:hypothetical protein